MVDSPQFVRELAQRVKGEVRFDETTRILYSTDASLYQIIPIGVVIPNNADDIVATVQVCAEHKVPILPRGSGTSLGGQTVGRAVVIDCSKYMNRILELNADEQWVRVQPGVILDELNAFLKPHRLQFAPDVATSNRASIGGMIGNNSSGAHSVIYGKTIDHVKELEVVLSDGARATLTPFPSSNGRGATGESSMAPLRDAIARITNDNRDEILARFPKILRRVAGYNLDRFLSPADQAQFAQPRLYQDSTDFNLAKIVCGSEGTLCTLVEAKLNLVPIPKKTALCVIHFHDLYESLNATPVILECEPSAVELTDKFILDLTKDNLTFAKSRTWIQDDPAAVLMVEFYGDSEDELKQKISTLKARIASARFGYAFYEAYDPAEQARVYNIRKSGLGLLMGLKGDAKPQGFIEDTAVAPEHLADYIRRLTKIINEHGCNAAYYAHASVGCLHVRPVMSIKSREGVARMHSICREACELVLEFGGSFSSEHGDGLVRSEFIERAYGPRLYEAFKQVKRVFDPFGLMNPGKIVDAPSMTENLRVEAPPPKSVTTYFNWDRDGGLMGHLELCSGVGACRKKLEGTMCPSYRATSDEKDTTRARANMFRSVMTGLVKAEGLASEELHEVLDLCLECKACKSECPSNVDMAKLKYEFLAHYYEKKGLPLRSRLMAHIATTNRIASRTPVFANALMNSKISRWFMKKIGIDVRRTLPQLAQQTFRTIFPLQMPRNPYGPPVILLNDTFTNYHNPEIGRAAVDVLSTLGYNVQLANIGCCGRPMISKGMLGPARALAQSNVERLQSQITAGDDAAFIVGLEPSCISALKDDYLDLAPGEQASFVADHTMMIEEFIVKAISDRPSAISGLFDSAGHKLLFHGHCHQKALFGTSATLDCLQLAGYDVTEIPSGCCGMAGSFGYESEHYDLSMQIGELVLFPAVRNAAPDVEIVAEGTSCRHQIAHGTGRAARHPIELLAEALRD